MRDAGVSDEGGVRHLPLLPSLPPLPRLLEGGQEAGHCGLPHFIQ